MAAAELALVARARGVDTRLLRRPALESLADADDVPAFARALSRLGAAIDPVAEPPDADAVEAAVLATAARHLRTLRRFQQRTPGVLDVMAADQDRRSLRALIRGAAYGLPTAARLAGLLPTPLLPASVLVELARQESPSTLVALLLIVGYPDAERLLPLVRQSQPDMFAIDLALLQAFADRATAAGRRDDTLRTFVADVIDIGNAQHAVLAAGRPRGSDPERSFVSGGLSLPRASFVAAAREPSAAAALAAVSLALRNSPLSAILPPVATEIARLDTTFLADRLVRCAHAARHDPLGTAAILLVLLRIQAQSRDLRMLAWGAALGAPAAARRAALVTPP